MKNFKQFLNESESFWKGSIYIGSYGVGYGALELPKSKINYDEVQKRLTSYIRDTLELKPILYTTRISLKDGPISYALMDDDGHRTSYNFDITVVTNEIKVFKLSDYNSLKDFDNALQEEFRKLPADVQKRANIGSKLGWMDIAVQYGGKVKKATPWAFEFSKDGNDAAKRLKTMFKGSELKSNVTIGTITDRSGNEYPNSYQLEDIIKQGLIGKGLIDNGKDVVVTLAGKKINITVI